VSDDSPRDARRLRTIALALFVPAGLLGAGAIFTMYRLGAEGGDEIGLARLGMALTMASLVLVVAGALLRDRAGKEPPEDDPVP
jgi:hypothetical protein